MPIVVSVLLSLRSVIRSRAALHLEILALRHQLKVLERSRRPRLRLTAGDRLLWIWFSRIWTEWRAALVLVQPDTVVKWHRRGFRLFWTWRSRHRTGRPTIPADVRVLIRSMSRANPLWGASHPRRVTQARDRRQSIHRRNIHGESPPATVADVANIPREPRRQVMAADFFVVPTATYRLLFVLVILAHERRRVVHVAVTDHPTSAWTAQQLRNAFPNEERPSYLLHDRDRAFAGIAGTITAMQIHNVVTAARSPWQNAYVERFIGSIRRECLDHVIVLSAAGLHRVVKDYVAYYMRSRTHLSLDKDSPTPRPVMPPTAGRIVEVPEIHGLHHRYERAAE
jgi:transposase InsO family protein